MSEEEIIRQFEEIVEESRQEDVYEYYIKLRNMLDLYNKEKEKNKKATHMLKDEIKHCEQEAMGSLNNEKCHIALEFDKHLLEILEEE